LNYYEHHIGDFAEATAHLTFVEDAAYSRIIRKYYATERPMPVDVKAVQRLVGARSKEEREAVESVLQEFFVLEEDGWHQKRCDADLQRYLAKQDKARASANARWSKPHSERNANASPTHMQTESERNANASETHDERNALQSPVTRHHKEEAELPLSFALPDWIPTEAWDGYVAMRKKQRKPMTDRARDLKLAELQRFRDAGHDVGAILDKSTANCWTDVYAPREGAAPRNGSGDWTQGAV